MNKVIVGMSLVASFVAASTAYATNSGGSNWCEAKYCGTPIVRVDSRNDNHNDNKNVNANKNDNKNVNANKNSNKNSNKNANANLNKNTANANSNALSKNTNLIKNDVNNASNSSADNHLDLNNHVDVSNANNHLDVSNAQKQGQHQDQAQTQTQSVANSGNSSNQNQSSAQGNSTNVNIEGDTYQTRRIPVATAYAPALTAGEFTCLGSFSGGIQTGVLGLSGGKTTVDQNCVMIRQVYMLQQMGQHKAACERARQDANIRAAMEAAGSQCEDPYAAEPVAEVDTSNLATKQEVKDVNQKLDNYIRVDRQEVLK